MRAGKCICCALVVGMLVFGASVYGQGPEYRWQPRAAGCTTLTNNQGSPNVPSVCEVAGVLGGPVSITLDVDMSNWGLAVGAPTLGTYQATINGNAGYASGDGCDMEPTGGCCPSDPFLFRVDIVHPRFVYRTIPFPPCSPLPALNLTTLNTELGASILGGCSITDPGTIEYGGELSVDVMPCSAGDYLFNFILPETKTFMNNQNGAKIDPLDKTGVIITIPTGKCCYAIGAGTTQCVHDVTETACNALQPGPRTFAAGEICTGDISFDCIECLSAADCDDAGEPNGGACTSDFCDIPPNVCRHELLYEPGFCCDPLAGPPGIEIDDGNECTEDVCNGDGSVDHNPLTGTPCDHVNACVINDICDAGVCVGDLPVDLPVPCTQDLDCPAGWFCETDTGFCDCRLSTPLCIDWLNTRYDDPCCFDEDDAVLAAIAIEAGTSVVTGGQFLVEYDADCLEFVSAAGIDPFLTTIDMDNEPGLLWIAVVAMDPADPEVVYTGTTGPADIVGLEFIMKGDLACCEPSSACLISVNPRNTLLTDEEGESVDLDICECVDCPRLNGDIDLVAPEGANVNADCGLPSAEVLWDYPTATDTCDGDLTIIHEQDWAQHNGGVPIGHLFAGGGVFPQGTSYFRVDAENSCGDTESVVWTVSVSDQHAIDVEVHLSPSMTPGMFSRCICFDLYADCSSAPTHMCEVMDFGGPYNFPAHAGGLLKVDKGNYMCIAAYDPLHTICAEAAVECIDNMWTATFKGDPLAGGNWLIGGNLNNDSNIDVLDAGMYMATVGANYGTGDTTCNDGAPQGDINADGHVDSADWTFIVENFLAACKSPCCDDPAAGVDDAITDISIKELRAMGLGYLSVADLNDDGRLNMLDMELYTQGGMAIQTPSKRSSSR